MISWLKRVTKMIRYGIGFLLILFALREMTGILSEYRFYFPPDFQAAGFLQGRESFFHGTYRIAFYVHIVCGPLAILIATFLVWSGHRKFQVRLHRTFGKVQFVLVLLLAPSGLVMATRSYTGTVAGIGFALLAVLTLASMGMLLAQVRRGELARHRVWATRLFIMLLSPILLRMISGAAVLTGMESDGLYQFSAWGSWLVPLMVYELWMQPTQVNGTRDANHSNSNLTGPLENFT